MKPPDHVDVLPWLELARADLAVADLVLRDPTATPEMLGLACFHAQQAAEKALKGVLVARDAVLPRSHDLVLLLERSGIGRDAPSLAARLAALNEFGVGPRYPGAPSARTREQAEVARADAAEVWKTVWQALTGEA